MACYDSAAQFHSCYLNNLQEKVERNFDNAFQLVDLWLANKMTFKKTNDKIQVAVKERWQSLFDALRHIEKCVFHGSIKSCYNENSFVNTKVFFF